MSVKFLQHDFWCTSCRTWWQVRQIPVLVQMLGTPKALEFTCLCCGSLCITDSEKVQDEIRKYKFEVARVWAHNAWASTSLSDYECIEASIKGRSVTAKEYAELVNLLRCCVVESTVNDLQEARTRDILRRNEAERRSGEDRREMVNHPLHYGGDVPHEVWKCLSAWGLEADAMLWTAVKYIARAGKKSPNKLEDLKKARWYLDNRIQQLEGAANEGS
jgi:hypothetical protein